MEGFRAILGASNQLQVLTKPENYAKHLALMSCALSWKWQRILNREWAVRPADRSREAIPDEATAKTIFPLDRSVLVIVFQRNVLPVPPWP
ncbi:hypothetical protein Tco_0377745 [Tanacetum coccineum]